MNYTMREYIGKALEAVRQSLYPYLRQSMTEIYGNTWEERAVKHLQQFQRKTLAIEETDPLFEDVAAQLTVINREWEKVFKQKLSPADRALVNELLAIRNQWAHQATFSTDDTFRATDSALRLLKSLDASNVAEVQKQRQQIFFILAQEQDRDKNKLTHISAEEKRISQNLQGLLQKLPFRNLSLLNQALTHTSYKYENPNTGEDNETLELIGDAVLSLLSCEYVYQKDTNLREDQITNWRSKLTGNKQLAQYAAKLELGQWLKIGKGEEHQGGRQKPSILSNAFEALVGAYYIDSGIEAVRNWIYPLFDDVWLQMDTTGEVGKGDTDNPKSKLQQIVLQPGFTGNPDRKPPEYKTTRSGGTDNEPEFTALVLVAGKPLGAGKGRSKKEAENKAARAALIKISGTNSTVT